MESRKKIDDGGLAFPVVGAFDVDYPGMTIRDYFAAKAMQGLLAHYYETLQQAAEEAYMYADAMLAARKK